MEELLPELVRVMEERLGKSGRPLTTFVVICLALGASAWGIRLFWDNLVFPLSQFVLNLWDTSSVTTSELLARVAVSLVFTIVFSGIAIIVLRYVVLKPIIKAKRDAEGIVEKGEAILHVVKDLIAQEESKQDDL